MGKQLNIQIASSLKEKFQKAKAVILTDYRGLTHKQSEELHKAVKKVDGEYIIVKNSLLKRASGIEATGPTAALLSYGDEIAPIKELFKFIKTITIPKVKFGMIGETRYTDLEIERIGKIPSREGLLYGLAYSLNFNVQKLAMVLKEVKDRDR